MRYTITENRYSIPEESLFTIGSRANNPKRDFLFISRLLGKHLAVKPDVVRAAGYMLTGLLYNKDIAEYKDCLMKNSKPAWEPMAEEKVLVIGFCETATGLGMAVADSIKGSDYIHTTRQSGEGMEELLSFEEEHSHATTHKLYSNAIKLKNYNHMILVDDEMTTGKSMLNLIKQISQQSGCTNFDILTLLDWRGQEFQAEPGISIKVHALIKGTIDPETVTVKTYTPPVLACESADTTDNHTCIIKEYCGRYGIAQKQMEQAEAAVKEAAQGMKEKTRGKRVLVLSEGENIYWPSRFAAHLDCAVCDFRTTSLSPVYPDGKEIHDCHCYMNNNYKYHFYNRAEAAGYDLVLFIEEQPTEVPALVEGMEKVIL